ncbi:MAG: beta strand repeat-containing protein [Hyphomicrobiaceae bacterium]
MSGLPYHRAVVTATRPAAGSIIRSTAALLLASAALSALGTVTARAQTPQADFAVNDRGTVNVPVDVPSPVTGKGGVFLDPGKLSECCTLSLTNGGTIVGTEGEGVRSFNTIAGGGVTITNNGLIQTEGGNAPVVGGTASIGVSVSTIGSGAVTIENNGGAEIRSLDGSFGSAVLVNADSGSTKITNNGLLQGYRGIDVVSKSGTVTIENGGTISGATGHGIIYTKGSGPVVITNNGYIEGAAGSVGFVGTSGTLLITNAGQMVGGITTIAGVTIVNEASGEFIGKTVVNGGTVTNNGGSFEAVDVGKAGAFFNTAGKAGAITNSGEVENGGTIASLDNKAGFFTNLATGVVTGASTVSGGTVVNEGTFQSSIGISGGYFSNEATGSVVGIVTITGGTVENYGGKLGDVVNSKGVFNNYGGTVGLLTNSGTATNGIGPSFEGDGETELPPAVIASLDNKNGTFANYEGATVTGASTISGGTVSNFGNFGSTIGITGGSFINQNGGTVAGTLTNNGGTVANRTGGTLADVVNTAGKFANAGTAGNVTNSGAASNSGIILSLANTGGIFANAATGSVDGSVTISGGSVANAGKFLGAVGLTGGSLSNSGTVAGTVTNANGSVTNQSSGKLADVVNNAGKFANAGIAQAVTNAGTGSNSGTITSLANNGGTFINQAKGTITGDVTVGGGAVASAGSVGGALDVTGGSFTNESGGKVVGVTTVTGGTVTNSGGAFGVVSNTAGGTFANTGGTAGAVTNSGIGSNADTIDSLVNSGSGNFTNTGKISGDVTVSGGKLTTTGNIVGTLTNSATTNASGLVGGAIVNNTGAIFNAIGNLNAGQTFTNASGASLNVDAGVTTVSGLVTNSGAIAIATGATLTAVSGLTNEAGGSVVVSSGGTLNDDLINKGVVTNNGAVNAVVASNTNSITNNGSWTGNVLSNTGTITNNQSWTGDIANAGTFIAGNASKITGSLTNAAGANFVVNGSTSVTGGLAMNGGVLNMQNGVAGGQLMVGVFNPTGTTLRFDYNAATRSADTIIATSSSPGSGNNVDVLVSNQQARIGSPGVTPLVQVGGAAAPQALGIGQVASSPSYQFLAGTNPSTTTVEYYLQQTPENSLYLGYRPTIEGSNPIAGLPLSPQASIHQQSTGNLVDKIIGNDIQGGQAVQVTPLFGVYASGQMGSSWHDGFGMKATAAGVTTSIGKSVDFSTRDSSFLAAGQIDIGKWAGIKDVGLKAGLITGWARTSLDFGSNDLLRGVGFTDTGAAHNDSYIFGGFGLVTLGQLYGLAAVTGSVGKSEVASTVLGATGSYDTSGVVAGVVGGMIVPATQLFGTSAPSNVAFDFRSGLSWSHHEGDAFHDSAGNRFGTTELEVLTGVSSAKVFAVYQVGTMAWRPFTQIGVAHRLDYDNRAFIGDTRIDFKDADTSVYVMSGSDIDISSQLKLNISGRGDFADDHRSFTGIVGVKLEFN